MPDPVDVLLNRLLRGISTNSVDTVRKAWRGLLDSQDLAIPVVRNKLASKVWKEKPRGPVTRYLGVMLALLYELDPQVFEDEIKRLGASRLHVLHRRTVDFMSKRCGDRLFGKLFDKVPVYIASDVTHPDLVFRSLQRWSQTPGLAISDITRVDVIARHRDMDYLGLYDLYFDAIILTRRNVVSSGMMRWLRSLRDELTFYHEVGHHFHQHEEGGQVEKQEREANRYAGNMFRTAHPALSVIVRILYFFIKPIRKRNKDKTETGTG